MKHTYEEFLEVIKTLRSENGCPWDREQTHASLKQCMLEEAYEVIDGIESYEVTGDYKNLREELGMCCCRLFCMPGLQRKKDIFPWRILWMKSVRR